MRICLIVIIFLCFHFATVGQTTEHEFRCWVNTYTLELPNDFRTSHSHYTEGDYYTFYRLDTIAKTDTTRLTLHCGSFVKLPHLTDSTFTVERTSELERSGTQTNGRNWRELNLTGEINIFYQGASFDEKAYLDEVISNILGQIKQASNRR